MGFTQIFWQPESLSVEMKKREDMNNTEESPIVLEVHNLSKSFGDFIANDHIDFDLRRGEIHCLLGENGAGKSTFAKCLYGAYQQDAGRVEVNCKEVSFSSPKDSIQFGIGMVHQHFVLVPTMTVVENIIAGVKKTGLAPGIKKAEDQILQLCEKFKVNIDPQALVGDLAVGEQQWVEILKTLFSGVEILILDEPTAALTPQESKQLFSIIHQMTADGMSVIFITHKLNEVLEVSDRTTIFRKGRVVGTVDTSKTNKTELATMMVGRGVDFQVEKDPSVPGSPILKIQDLHIANAKKRGAVNSFDLTIYENEIVGVAGVGGNGQNELFDAIVGIRTVQQGKIILDEVEITNHDPTDIMEMGLASIPADRMTQGLLLRFNVAENLILGRQWKSPYFTGLMFDEDQIISEAERMIREYSIATSGPKQMAARLSGGNLQKLILARELSRDIRCVIAHCPTRGLDVGAIEYVHKRLVELRDQGIGVLLISEDLDEIFNVADRIAVIYKGHIMGKSSVSKTTREQVGLLMAGVKEEIQ